jgi:hypothetical protein
VEKMMQRGMMKELEDFHEVMNMATLGVVKNEN